MQPSQLHGMGIVEAAYTRGLADRSMPWLSDERVESWKDLADRRTARERRQPYGRQVMIRQSWEDSNRRTLERKVAKLFKEAQPGDNEVDPKVFEALVDWALPPKELDRMNRRAQRTGRLEWTGGIVFVRGHEQQAAVAE